MSQPLWKNNIVISQQESIGFGTTEPRTPFLGRDLGVGKTMFTQGLSVEVYSSYKAQSPNMLSLMKVQANCGTSIQWKVTQHQKERRC